jgi:hypothetical protein
MAGSDARLASVMRRLRQDSRPGARFGYLHDFPFHAGGFQPRDRAPVDLIGPGCAPLINEFT